MNAGQLVCPECDHLVLPDERVSGAGPEPVEQPRRVKRCPYCGTQLELHGEGWRKMDSQPPSERETPPAEAEGAP